MFKHAPLHLAASLLLATSTWQAQATEGGISS